VVRPQVSDPFGSQPLAGHPLQKKEGIEQVVFSHKLLSQRIWFNKK
jgi:hypothetical protein